MKMSLSLQKINNKEKKQRILDISKQLGIEQLLHKTPLELSGGQKQRVAIARAIVKKPNVILADEPTGALDSKTSKEIMDILKEISKDYLVIMVTHNDLLAKEYSDRIITMSDGCVVSDNIYNNIHKATEKIKKERKKTPLLSLIKASFNNLRKRLVRI